MIQSTPAMLDAGRPPQHIAGLTLFFDHADAQRRYMLADTPRLLADPEPQLSLLLFRGEDAGGLLQLEATLAPSDEQLAAAERELTAMGRPATLVRPDWRSGTVHVAGWVQAGELAPQSLFVGAPSLVGDPLAVVAARLDAAGAALADAALRGNALPTALVFELETLGLAGPLGVEVEADLQALHDRLTAEGALTTPYGRARIAKTWESAERDHLIRVRVVDESGELEGQRAEAMRRVGEDLIARMFSPYPPPERPPMTGDETVAPFELSFRLTARREQLATSSRWDFRERRAVTVRHHAGASLVDLLGHHRASDYIHAADLSASRDAVLVRIEPELAALGIAALEVDLRRAGDAPSHSVVLDDASPQQRIALQAGDARPLQYRARARFDAQHTRAPDRESDWHEVIGRLAVVSARRLFAPRRFSVVAGRVEFDWLDHVELVVEAAGPPPRSLLLRADSPAADIFFAGAGEEPLTVTAHWRGRIDEPSLTEPARTLEDDTLVLDSPFADSIVVLLVPLPLADVATLSVDLRVQHDDFVHRKAVSWDAPDREPQRIGLRRLAGSPRRYAYRVHVVRNDGALDPQPWLETDATTLVVGAAGPVDIHRTEVVLLGGGPAARGSLAVELVFEAGEQRANALLEADRDSATLVLALAPDSPPPQLVAREFLANGVVRETRWDDPPSLVVVPMAALER